MPRSKSESNGMGRVYVYASFNNTLVTVTDEGGKTVAWGSSGKAGPRRGRVRGTLYLLSLLCPRFLPAGDRAGRAEWASVSRTGSE